ncbi:hypothetical protein GH714_009534 [Hevea brasiliensis]|uniref:Sey1/RHD3-like three-helix bundle domain-containing protein n=1 Tax=Hevea brasiliensis TaxID=3981 RepID=A0A6A6LRH6_HEVBR|nr:hypothetical protein GH714_009534 [Hevea brasiliensis]
MQLVHPAYLTILGHLRSKTLENFKSRLEQSLNCGEGFAASVRTCGQSCMLEFDKGCADASIRLAKWDASKVREKLRRDIETHASSVCNLKLSEMIKKYEKQLAGALTEPVESLFEAGGRDTWVSIRGLLKRETEVAVSGLLADFASFELDRFSAVFNHDNDSMPRVWTGKEDIRTITKDARSASLKLLSVMAAIRLDEKPDKIEKYFFPL